MLESKLKSKVCQSLKKNGWMVIQLIQTNTNGIPDTMCVKNGRTVFIEFKQEGKKPRPLQVHRINQLKEHKIEVYLVDNVNFKL